MPRRSPPSCLPLDRENVRSNDLRLLPQRPEEVVDVRLDAVGQHRRPRRAQGFDLLDGTRDPDEARTAVEAGQVTSPDGGQGGALELRGRRPRCEDLNVRVFPGRDDSLPRTARRRSCPSASSVQILVRERLRLQDRRTPLADEMPHRSEPLPPRRGRRTDGYPRSSKSCRRASRLSARTLRRMLFTWLRTVTGETTSRRAIAAVVSSWRRRSSTCHSRLVSVS